MIGTQIRSVPTAAQCRASRAMADLSIAKLARIAGVSAVVVRNYEREASTPSIRELEAVLKALETLGIRCSIDMDGVETVSIDWRLTSEKLTETI